MNDKPLTREDVIKQKLTEARQILRGENTSPATPVQSKLKYIALKGFAVSNYDPIQREYILTRDGDVLRISDNDIPEVTLYTDFISAAEAAEVIAAKAAIAEHLKTAFLALAAIKGTFIPDSSVMLSHHEKMAHESALAICEVEKLLNSASSMTDIIRLKGMLGVQKNELKWHISLCKSPQKTRMDLSKYSKASRAKARKAERDALADEVATEVREEFGLEL